MVHFSVEFQLDAFSAERGFDTFLGTPAGRMDYYGYSFHDVSENNIFSIKISKIKHEFQFLSTA